MGERIQCFLLRPSVYAEETLRRYSDSPCLGLPGHDASIVIGTQPYPLSDCDGESGVGISQSDPRWPTTCSCGYTFTPEDSWQHRLTRLYWREDHISLRTTLDKAPVGSVYYADWYPWRGPDGHCLVVVTPAGPWVVDGPSRNQEGAKGGSWARTGKVPNVTANPSIHFPGKYHGWLKDGFLIEL